MQAWPVGPLVVSDGAQTTFGFPQGSQAIVAGILTNLSQLALVTSAGASGSVTCGPGGQIRVPVSTQPITVTGIALSGAGSTGQAIVDYLDPEAAVNYQVVAGSPPVNNTTVPVTQIILSVAVGTPGQTIPLPVPPTAVALMVYLLADVNGAADVQIAIGGFYSGQGAPSAQLVTLPVNNATPASLVSAPIVIPLVPFIPDNGNAPAAPSITVSGADLTAFNVTVVACTQVPNLAVGPYQPARVVSSGSVEVLLADPNGPYVGPTGAIGWGWQIAYLAIGQDPAAGATAYLQGATSGVDYTPGGDSAAGAPYFPTFPGGGATITEGLSLHNANANAASATALVRLVPLYSV